MHNFYFYFYNFKLYLPNLKKIISYDQIKMEFSSELTGHMDRLFEIHGQLKRWPIKMKIKFII